MLNHAGITKCCFPEPCTNETPAVFCIHGLMMNASHMQPIAKYLSNAGFLTVLYDYPTRLKGITGHGLDLKEQISAFLKEHPSRTLHFITHSMGGLICRVALSELSQEERKKIGRIVMLAPPNGGSSVARHVCRYLSFASKIWHPISDLTCAPDSPVSRLPGMDGYEFAVIAAEHDQLVAEEFTHLPREQEHLIIEHEFHITLPYNKKVMELSARFLREGHFH